MCFTVNAVPGGCVATCFRGQGNAEVYTYEYRAEKFLPPYFFLEGRPNITSIEKSKAAMGETLVLAYSGNATHAVLMRPSSVTHQADMGQRGVRLQNVQFDVQGSQLSVKLPPPGGLVAPAGFYMLFLMNGVLPCTKAVWLQLTEPVPGDPAANHAPIAYPDRYSTLAGTPVTVSPLSNDADMDGQALQFDGWVTLPTMGTLVPAAGNASYTYVPSPGAFGTDSMMYVVSDKLASVTGVVTVNIGECKAVRAMCGLMQGLHPYLLYWYVAGYGCKSICVGPSATLWLDGRVDLAVGCWLLNCLARDLHTLAATQQWNEKMFIGPPCCPKLAMSHHRPKGLTNTGCIRSSFSSGFQLLHLQPALLYSMKQTSLQLAQN